MIQTQISHAQQTLLAYLKEHQSPSLLLQSYSLSQAYMCDKRSFYVFELNYVNANGPKMAIVGNYYSFDPAAKAQVMLDLGNLSDNIAQIVIKSFVKNNPRDPKVAFDKSMAFENVAKLPFKMLSDSFTPEDQLKVAEFMSSHSVTSFVFFKSPELNLEQVVETYHKLWGAELNKLSGFNMQQGEGEGFVSYLDTNIYITAVQEPMPDELLVQAASLAADWPNAYEMAKQGSHVFQLTLDNQQSRALKTTELVRWLCALMLANGENVTALMYNFYLFNPQNYLKNAHELQEHPDKAPLANLLYFACARQENNALKISTIGMESLDRLEMAYLLQNGDNLSPQEAILILKLLGEHLLKNNEYLQDNTTFSLNEGLNMKCSVQEDDQHHKYCLITRNN